MAMPYNTVMIAGPRFDEVGPDGIRRIGNRAGQPAMRGGQVIPAAPEQTIWTIRPDGTATLSRKYIAYKPEYLAASRNWSQYRGPAEPGMVIAFEGNRGGPFYTYNFSPDGLTVFRMAASLFPNGVVERGISVNGLQWPAWDFPFTATDSAKMRQWVTSLSAADAFAMYYSLLAYDGPEMSGCKWRKFMPGVSPKEFDSNYFWAVFQEMVLRSIYDIRTDLHKVRDPDTGATIDGLIKYDLFAMPCKPGIGEIIFEVIASVALGVVTAGAGAALATALKTIDIAKSIYDMKASADKQKAALAFENSVIKGYTSGTDIRNILNPPPELSQVEKELLAKASGETKSPTESGSTSSGAVTSSGGGLPWLLIAGAAAALLS
jgi:hypothetical protein